MLKGSHVGQCQRRLPLDLWACGDHHKVTAVIRCVWWGRMLVSSKSISKARSRDQSFCGEVLQSLGHECVTGNHASIDCEALGGFVCHQWTFEVVAQLADKPHVT